MLNAEDTGVKYKSAGKNLLYPSLRRYAWFHLFAVKING